MAIGWLILPLQFVASDLLEYTPPQLACGQRQKQRSHNNVDLTFFEGRYYLAVRAAPSHFPSRRAELRILHSTDLVQWVCDTSFFFGCDVREPRWLVWKDSLYLYFFLGSQQSWRFDSEGIQGMVRTSQGKWEGFSIGWEGWVPWRARAVDSVIYLSVYWGRRLYGPKHRAAVRLLRSVDARNWKPITESPQLTAPYATETDFWITKEGSIWAITRAEGKGSYLSFALRPEAPWTFTELPYKYDSPLLFHAPDGLYLVARRHPLGKADIFPRFFPAWVRRYGNLLLYSLSRKRTALYRIDTLHRRVDWVMDLPGWGDTAFPAIYPPSGSDFVLINYTSPLEGTDRWWLRGQIGQTHLYRLRLRWRPACP